MALTTSLFAHKEKLFLKATPQKWLCLTFPIKPQAFLIVFPQVRHLLDSIHYLRLLIQPTNSLLTTEASHKELTISFKLSSQKSIAEEPYYIRQSIYDYHSNVILGLVPERSYSSWGEPSEKDRDHWKRSQETEVRMLFREINWSGRRRNRGAVKNVQGKS